MRSYVAIHMALIFAVGTLITGSIWAKASWGHWWVWNEPTLVSFLIVFLLYATYQPLRFSIEDPERQSRYAVRVRDHRRRVRADELPRRAARRASTPPARARHPTGGNCPGRCCLTFLLAIGSAWRCCTRRSASTRWRPRAQRRCKCAALRPALLGQARRTSTDAAPPRCVSRAALRSPGAATHTAGKYVAGAYIVFVVAAADLRGDHGHPRDWAGSSVRLPRSTSSPSDRRDDGAANGGGHGVSELLALGMSHKTAPVELRERLALTDARRPSEFLRELRRRRGDPRGGRDLDLQPDRAVPGGRRPGRGREPTALGDAGPARRDPPDRAGRPRSTRCATATPRATSSGSPPGWSRWSSARPRSRARSGAPTRRRSTPAPPAPLLNRLFRGGAARPASACGPRRRSASVR